MFDTIIIGGGASGLVAAIFAIKNNEKVLLLEKMPQCGMKLRITGKGRCNITNTLPLKEFLTHCGSEPRFLFPAFSKFFNTELISFFEDLGLKTVIERGNRVFPASGKAQDVFLALINFLEDNDCTIIKNTRVTNLILKENKVIGVETKHNDNKSSNKNSSSKNFYAPKVILASGGQSYPNTGSDGDGIKLAKSVGHTIIDTYPSLVGLRLLHYNANDIYPRLINFETKNVEAVVKNNQGKIIAKEFGDITFREDHIDGPIILTLSRQVAQILGKEKLYLELDFKPAIEQNTLDTKLQSELNQRGRESIESTLRAFLPLELIYLLKSKTRINFSKPSSQINKEERKEILNLIKNMSFEIVDSMGFQRAVVTKGGVSLKEVNPKTLESKLINGLFFCGEVLDLDADTGGYNLQIAFSTGHLAAQKHFQE